MRGFYDKEKTIMIFHATQYYIIGCDIFICEKRKKKNKVIFFDKVNFNFLPNAKILSCEHKNVERTSLCNERISREESKYSPSWNSFHFFAIFHEEYKTTKLKAA